MNAHRPIAAAADARYFPGFANHIATEAIAGALPIGQNSPQIVPFGLYAEQLSGSAFTAPRAENRRSWLYRLRPAAQHGAFTSYPGTTKLRTAPFDEVAPSPNRLRWDPLPYPDGPTDWVDGIKNVEQQTQPAALEARGLKAGREP